METTTDQTDDASVSKAARGVVGRPGESPSPGFFLTIILFIIVHALLSARNQIVVSPSQPAMSHAALRIELWLHSQKSE